MARAGSAIAGSVAAAVAAIVVDAAKAGAAGTAGTWSEHVRRVRRGKIHHDAVVAVAQVAGCADAPRNIDGVRVIALPRPR